MSRVFILNDFFLEENAVLEFTFELRFTDCTFNKTTIENKVRTSSI